MIINTLTQMKKQNKLLTIFSQVDDPRRDLGKEHNLNDILLIGVISVICGADTWNQMEQYALEKEDFLKTFLKLENGIPSHDTFNRVFSAIDPNQFEHCFMQWAKELSKLNDKEVVAIDGKTLRGAKSRTNKSPYHIVSAWASEQNIVLGQVKTDEKSNEITAIPKLLRALCIENTVVTIDAMGCQEKIARTIIEQKADYVLAVKENQKQLYQDIKDEFRFAKDLEVHTSENVDHGRIETRKCSVITNFQHIENPDKWQRLKCIVKIESQREFKNSDKPMEKATRYYISSLKSDAEYFQSAIRLHWTIENKLHWVLDVSFSEDDSRKRTGNAAQNFAILSKIALNLLKNDKSVKIGVKGKRLKAAWSNKYLMKILKL